MPDDTEDRRRAADGQDTEDDDDMRQGVHIDQLHIPASTKWTAGIMLAGIAGLVSWNLLTTLAIKESQADDKREIWIAMGRQEARLDVAEVRLQSAESRLDKIEDRK